MDKSNQKSVVIVAGGMGSRMKTDLPKQFIEIAGKPVLMHTILKFYHCFQDIQIVVVLPFEQIETWNRLISEYRFTIPHQIAPGGTERFYSVKKGLAMIQDTGVVAIHDGVRPLVSEKVIKQSFQAAQKSGGAIPVIRPAESLRKISKNENLPVNRNDYRLVQTPQTFQTKRIKKAYEQPYETRFTDDATVFEAAGNTISLIDGNIENIKITHPFDLKVVQLILADNQDKPKHLTAYKK